MFMKKIIALLFVVAIVVCGFPSRMTDSMADISPKGGYLDKISFGNQDSEQAHNFKGEFTKAIVGGLGETGRVCYPRVPATCFTGDLTFTMKVDPVALNYLTLKIWGSDVSGLRVVIGIGDEIVGALNTAEYYPLDPGFNPTTPGRFFYSTGHIPLKFTQGKDELELSIRSMDPYNKVTSGNSKGYYAAYTHTGTYIDISDEKQGKKLDVLSVNSIRRADISENEKKRILNQYRIDQINLANEYATNAKLNIAKYNNQLRYLAISLTQPWTPAKTAADKRSILFQIFRNIDNHVSEYFRNTRMVTRGGHQGDWGAFYGELGESLFLVENLIFDDNILGRDAFEAFLEEPFRVFSEDGESSLKNVDWDGGRLTRRGAWERCLKASFDSARYRLSYIYNQVYYTYEGAFKAHEGLGVIGSQFYEGKERSVQILGEALGVRPYLGEEILVGPDGEELDLYHSLYFHDTTAIFTRDQLSIIAKGLAKSKLNEDGTVARRLPYGTQYYGLTVGGMPRENNYVGNYGETTNYLPEWFYRTLGHEGFEELNDDILKACLKNIYARSYTRFTDLSSDGKRTMWMEQITDSRNNAMKSKEAYASIDSLLLFASLEKHMADNEERYSGPEWDEYWELASHAVGFAQQRVADRNMFSKIVDTKKDFRAPETYKYITEDRAKYSRFGKVNTGIFHPHTDFRFYTQDELDEYDINPDEYMELAWVDVDNGYFSIREGELSIFFQMLHCNKGFGGVGRMRVLDKDTEILVQPHVEGILRTEEYRLRPNQIRVTHVPDGDTSMLGVSNALAGELLPIAYQEGVGRVERDSERADTPYSGLADVLISRYKNYFMVVNTTRDEYENSRVYHIDIPADYTDTKIYDMISKTWMEVLDGKVAVQPLTGYAFKLTSDFQTEIKPSPVTITLAQTGTRSAGILWKRTAGAATYNVMRSTSRDGEYETIAEEVDGTFYRDTTVVPNQKYFYKVSGVNQYGEGVASYSVEFTLKPSETIKDSPWRDDGINAVGRATVNQSVITINDADGTGLKDGDDSNIYKRDIKDSFRFVSRLIAGDAVITAKIDSYEGSASGIMLRSEINPDTEYIYFGADKEGKLILRHRTKESYHPGAAGTVISPIIVDNGTYNAEEYPYVRLIRDANLATINAYVSKDGEIWQRVVKEMNVPILHAAHVGVVTTDNAQFSQVTIANTKDIDQDSISDLEDEETVQIQEDDTNYVPIDISDYNEEEF